MNTTHVTQLLAEPEPNKPADSLDDPEIRLEGSVEKVTFHSEDSGYSVLRVRSEQYTDLLTVVGFALSANPGEVLECHGKWVQNKDYGKQFQARTIRSIPPTTREGIEKYLASGMVPGIGPHFAKRLIQTFGDEVFEVIEKSPHRLKEVPGIGARKIEKIGAAWKDQKMVREIMIFLQSFGVAPSKAVRIFKTYGDTAIEQVRSNPYRLAQDIHGIGFQLADQIGEQLGIPKNSMIRARAGLHSVLREKVLWGHCAFPEQKILQQACQLLNIDLSILITALQCELEERQLIRDTVRGEVCIYPADVYLCETEVAQVLKDLANGEPPWKISQVDEELAWVQEETDFQLAPLQIEALKTALTSKVTLITGGPGTGKSTLTRFLVRILQNKGIRMALCSPTGRAAKRLSECTGLEAKTIHRTLRFDPRQSTFFHHQENPLPIDLLLLDEASMVDIRLAHQLFQAIPKSASVVILGDADQLPSVGPGQFLADLINSKTIATVKLTEIFRQAEQSRIVRIAHQIKQGEFPELQHDTSTDFFFIHSETPASTVSKVVDLVQHRIPNKFGLNPILDIQVLCPMQKGPVGTLKLNVELQKALNPPSGIQVQRFGYTYALGDKVMVLQNDYDKEVFNGDLGLITHIRQEEQECVIRFEDREITFEFGELDILQPAYAVTIHKSQGSEYPAVVIPLMTQHFPMLKRNLVYTGITRGKKLVVLVGQKRALMTAIQAHQPNERFTHLSERFRNLSS